MASPWTAARRQLRRGGGGEPGSRPGRDEFVEGGGQHGEWVVLRFRATLSGDRVATAAENSPEQTRLGEGEGQVRAAEWPQSADRGPGTIVSDRGAGELGLHHVAIAARARCLIAPSGLVAWLAKCRYAAAGGHVHPPGDFP